MPLWKTAFVGLDPLRGGTQIKTVFDHRISSPDYITQFYKLTQTLSISIKLWIVWPENNGGVVANISTLDIERDPL